MSKKAPSRLSYSLPTGDDNTIGSRCLRRNTFTFRPLCESPEKMDGMLTDFFGWHFPAISTELLQVSLRSVGADGRKKRELQRHAESQLNYLEEPHGVQRLPGPRLPIHHLHVCLFFFFLLIHWMLKDTNIILLLLLSTITRKTQLKIIIHDIDSLHKPHRLWIQKISQHFSGRTPLIFHLY